MIYVEDFKDALIEYVSAGLLVLEESPEMYWRLKSHADNLDKYVEVFKGNIYDYAVVYLEERGTFETISKDYIDIKLYAERQFKHLESFTYNDEDYLVLTH